MTFPTRSRSADHKSSAPAPEHGWISEQSTLNPSPGPLLKQRRDILRVAESAQLPICSKQ